MFSGLRLGPGHDICTCGFLNPSTQDQGLEVSCSVPQCLTELPRWIRKLEQSHVVVGRNLSHPCSHMCNWENLIGWPPFPDPGEVRGWADVPVHEQGALHSWCYPPAHAAHDTGCINAYCTTQHEARRVPKSTQKSALWVRKLQDTIVGAL